MDLAQQVVAGEDVPERVVTKETTFTQEQATEVLATASTEASADPAATASRAHGRGRVRPIPGRTRPRGRITPTRRKPPDTRTENR